MKILIVALFVSLLSACANVNTLDDLKTQEPESPLYVSNLSLSELDKHVSKFVYSCYKSKRSTVSMNGAALGGVSLSIDRHVSAESIDYVIKRRVRDGFNHWIMVSLQKHGKNESSGKVFMDDLMPSYAFGKFEKAIKKQEIDCPVY